jgi:hypothetical protein
MLYMSVPYDQMLPVPGTATVEVLGIGSKAQVPLDGGVPKTQRCAFHIHRLAVITEIVVNG